MLNTFLLGCSFYITQKKTSKFTSNIREAVSNWKYIKKGIERLREKKKENRERGENERRERLRMNEINGERIK